MFDVVRKLIGRKNEKEEEKKREFTREITRKTISTRGEQEILQKMKPTEKNLLNSYLDFKSLLLASFKCCS